MVFEFERGGEAPRVDIRGDAILCVFGVSMMA